MNDSSLVFELLVISLLFTAGIALVMTNLPGWGLITTAGVLSVLSFSLRKTAVRSVEQPQLV